MYYLQDEEKPSKDSKSWLFIGAASAVLLLSSCSLPFLAFMQMDGWQKEFVSGVFSRYFGYIAGAVILLLFVLLAIVGGILRNYTLPLRRIAEEAAIINTNNPSLRVGLEGCGDVRSLAQAINDSAEKMERLQTSMDRQIRFAREEVETEKNILSAIMSELLDGVIVCNSEGQILLYNRRAQVLLQESAAAGLRQSTAGGSFAGLGRSIFSLLDKASVTHALDDVAGRIATGRHPVSRFFIAGSEEGNIGADVIPIMSDNSEFKGFVLMLQSNAGQNKSANSSDFLLQNALKSLKKPLQNISLAAEALLRSSGVEPEQARKFKEIIARDAAFASNSLGELSLEYSKVSREKHPLVQISQRDFFAILCRDAEEKIGVTLIPHDEPETHWLKVDVRSFALSLLFLLKKTVQETGENKMQCRTRRKGSFTTLDITWAGTSPKIETLRFWEEQNVIVGREGIPATLKEVLDAHEAKIWPYIYEITRERAGIRVFLPDVAPAVTDGIRKFVLPSSSRPEYYDFDLFAPRNGEIREENTPLTNLAYTVFDTETTGLMPESDEIISLGAVRIVNGKLLKNEIFDAMVNPGCSLTDESVQVHGIQPEMLVGKPPLKEVLPVFCRFAEGTVLVAHNAAFDMKMLQMKEVSTGVRFNNPVLDTLLLSAVVHPSQDSHNLESIAARFGVSVIGRHTALGDALMTGEIFLKLLPLLEKKGIRTLDEAIAASQKTPFARIRY